LFIAGHILKDEIRLVLVGMNTQKPVHLTQNVVVGESSAIVELSSFSVLIGTAYRLHQTVVAPGVIAATVTNHFLSSRFILTHDRHSSLKSYSAPICQRYGISRESVPVSYLLGFLKILQAKEYQRILCTLGIGCEK
jgi:hypothetical protein